MIVGYYKLCGFAYMLDSDNAASGGYARPTV